MLDRVIEEIMPLSEEAMNACRSHWDSLCKPLGGLGDLEDMVVKIAGIKGTAFPEISKRAIVIMGADNGVVAEGVSQTGSEVTAQVLENMGEGKSSVCIMARALHADVIPVNIGMNTDGRHPAIKNCAVRYGTGNIAVGPAMTRQECIRAIEQGIRIVGDLKNQGYEMILVGEMGIGNTTTSAACASVILKEDAKEVTGHGAGLSADGLKRKVEVVRKALQVNHPDPANPIDIISKVGGLDIAGMTGCYLGAAYYHIPALIDGLISGIAAYFASQLCPLSRDYMLATHCSAEPAGEKILQLLGLRPILYANMHLGEGTGAAAVLPLLDQTLNLYDHLPGFSEGKVEAYVHFEK